MKCIQSPPVISYFGCCQVKSQHQLVFRYGQVKWLFNGLGFYAQPPQGAYHLVGKTLEKQGVYVALRQNDTGLIYGITYVDHQTKCVFNGSVFGKQYSAKAIQERCQTKAVPGQKFPAHSAQEPIGSPPQANAFEAETKAHPKAMQIAATFKEIENIMDILMQTEQTSNYLPYQLKKKRKRRKRKNLNNNLKQPITQIIRH